jgi:hypothetical protein
MPHWSWCPFIADKYVAAKQCHIRHHIPQMHGSVLVNRNETSVADFISYIFSVIYSASYETFWSPLIYSINITSNKGADGSISRKRAPEKRRAKGKRPAVERLLSL